MRKNERRRLARRKPRRRRSAIPSKAVRRINSPQPPTAVVLFFNIAARKVAKDFARAVSKILYPRVANFAKKEDDAARTDAEEDDDDLDDLMAELEAAAEDSFEEEAFVSSWQKAATRALSHSKKEFDRLKIHVPKEPKLKWLVDGWQRDIVARAKGVQASQLEKIRKILADGEGHRAETLADEITRQVEDVTESRAEFIARDSVLTLNAKITQERQTSAGIEEYVWSTSLDERVREEHEDLDGETFSWDEGDPQEGHPGEAENCRCVAYPILPELDDEDDEG